VCLIENEDIWGEMLNGIQAPSRHLGCAKYNGHSLRLSIVNNTADLNVHCSRSTKTIPKVFQAIDGLMHKLDRRRHPDDPMCSRVIENDTQEPQCSSSLPSTGWQRHQDSFASTRIS
jgi:hypothetical protein